MTVRLELVRLVRSRRPLIALAACALFLGLMLLGFWTYAQTETGGAAEFRYTFENRSYFNGLTFALYAFYFAYLLVLPVFAATEGGVQIAGDTASGSLRLLLARPITRARIFAGKLAVAAAWSTLLAGFLLALALVIGLTAVGWGDLDIYPGVLQMTDRHQHLNQAAALTRFVLAWPLASLGLLVPLTLAFWVSSLSTSPVNAVATSISVYLIVYVVGQIHFFRELRPWLFTSSMACWRDLFREEVPWRRVAAGAARLAGWAVLFTTLALGRFRRREEP